MEKKLSFNENPINYDKYRPDYTPELFEEIIKYSGVCCDSNTVEIGIGTGLATQPFIDLGCKIDAIEIGANLSEFCRKKFCNCSNLTVHNISFEEYTAKSSSVDLIYCATAFHWLASDTAFKKIKELLVPGGTIALFWNNAIPSMDNLQLYDDIQAVYRKYAEVYEDPRKDRKAIYKDRYDLLVNQGFMNVESKYFYDSRTFSAKDYTKLLDTYSSHIMMNEDDRFQFNKEIEYVINKNGGFIEVTDTIDLYLGKKA